MHYSFVIIIIVIVINYYYYQARHFISYFQVCPTDTLAVSTKTYPLVWVLNSQDKKHEVILLVAQYMHAFVFH